MSVVVEDVLFRERENRKQRMFGSASSTITASLHLLFPLLKNYVPLPGSLLIPR
jgi:hypothetical protein